MMTKETILKQNNKLRNCWLSLVGLVQTAILVTLKTNCLSTIVIVADLVNLILIHTYYLIVVASIVTRKRIKTASIKTVKYFVIQEHAHLVTSMCRYHVSAEKRLNVHPAT
jgi:uncharacterized membrane protein